MAPTSAGKRTALFWLVPLTIGAFGYGYLGLVAGAIGSPQVVAPLMLCCGGWAAMAAGRPRWALAITAAGLAALVLAGVLEVRATANWED